MPRVRLPNSAPRKGIFSKLIRSVGKGGTAWSWQGKIFKPGATVEEADLWPEQGYPERPLLLEHAGISRPGWGHRRSENLYVLWQYYGGEWRELARATSIADEWAVHLYPVALAALEKSSRPEPEPPDVRATTERLQSALAAELDRLPDGAQLAVLGALHDFFSSRVLRVSAGGWAPSSDHPHTH